MKKAVQTLGLVTLGFAVSAVAIAAVIGYGVGNGMTQWASESAAVSNARQDCFMQGRQPGNTISVSSTYYGGTGVGAWGSTARVACY